MAFATRKIVKGPEGRPHVQFVSVPSGEPIPFDQIGNYTLIEHGPESDLDKLNLDGKKTETDTEEVEDTEQERDKPIGGDRGGYGGVAGFDPDVESLQGMVRDITNNYGYINRPALFDIAQLAPGLIGTAARAINTAINVSNAEATKMARESLGFGPQSLGDRVKSILSDQKGYIGDLKIGENQYAVGFEASTKDGRTTLTPAEASRRAAGAQARGIETREATKDEVAQVQKDFEYSQGFIDRAIGTAKEAIGEVTNPSRVTDAFRNVDTQRDAVMAPSVSLAPSRGITPGKGLANLAPNGLIGGVGVKSNFGPETVGPPQSDLTKAVQLAAANVFGPGYTVNQTSGARNNSPNHKGGRAVDFNVTDPNGNRVTDQAKLEAFARELGNQGIKSLGHGPGYMGPGMFHAGVARSPLGADSWGKKGGQPNFGVRDAFREGVANTPIGILPFETEALPTTRPTIEDNVDSTTALTSYAPQERQSPAQQAIEQALTGDVQAPRGIPNEVLTEMVTTIAGELGSNTIQGILSGDPRRVNVARREVADIASTMLNRQMATGNWNQVVDGTQYNSRMPQNMGTTLRNQSLIGGFLEQALGDFNAGTLTGNAPNATHYHASYMTPSWAGSSFNQVQSGEHIFSNVNQRGTNVQEYRRQPPAQGPIPDSRPGAQYAGGGDQGGYGGVGADPYGGGGFADVGGHSPGGTGTSGGTSGTSGSGRGSNNNGDIGSVSIGGLISENPDGSYSVYGDGGGSSVSHHGSFNSAVDAASPGTKSGGGGYVSAGVGAHSVSTTSVGAGAGAGSHHSGGAGSLGQSYGAGGGHQGVAGISGSAGTGYSKDAQSIGGTFGGQSAGSLGGSASGLGTGLGAAGAGHGFSSAIDSSGKGYGAGLGSQSDGGDGGDKVICGHYNQKGVIPDDIYREDVHYSDFYLPEETREGYLLWARPIVKFLQKKEDRPVTDKIIGPLASAWAHEMAYRTGYIKKRTFLGRAVTSIGEPLCYVIGKIRRIFK